MAMAKKNVEYVSIPVRNVFRSFDKLKRMLRGCSYGSNGIFVLVPERTDGIRNLRFHNTKNIEKIDIVIGGKTLWKFNNIHKESGVSVSIWRDYNILPLGIMKNTLPMINIVSDTKCRVHVSYEFVYGIGDASIMSNLPLVTLHQKLNNSYLVYSKGSAIIKLQPDIGRYSSNRCGNVVDVDNTLIRVHHEYVADLVYRLNTKATERISDTPASIIPVKELIIANEDCEQAVYEIKKICPDARIEYRICYIPNENEADKQRNADCEKFVDYLRFLNIKKDDPQDELISTPDEEMIEMMKKYIKTNQNVYPVT